MVKPNPIPPHNFSESLQLFHKIYIIHACTIKHADWHTKNYSEEHLMVKYKSFRFFMFFSRAGLVVGRTSQDPSKLLIPH